MDIRRLESVEELVAVAAGDYLVRCDVRPDPDSGGLAWATDGAFAYGGSPDGPDFVDWLMIIGPPSAAAALAPAAVAELPRPPYGMSAPRECDFSGLGTRFEEWDYMVREASGLALPVQPGEERVEILPPGPETDAEVSAFLPVANPDHSTKPGGRGIELWAGIRDKDGTLLAVGAFCRRATGAAYLASIGTLPSARGQGLGAAVSAWLTRRSLDAGEPFCALGHWVPNEAARRIYLRLGYQTTHRMSSWRFGGPSDADADAATDSNTDADSNAEDGATS